MGYPTIAAVIICARLWVRVVAALVEGCRWTHELNYYIKHVTYEIDNNYYFKYYET